MIHISNAYKKAIYGRSDWYPSARVTFLDGTVLNLGRSEFLISGNNIVDGAGTQSLPLGNVVSRKITVIFQMRSTSRECPFPVSTRMKKQLIL